MALFLSQPGTQVQEQERRGALQDHSAASQRASFLSLRLGLLLRQGFVPREDASSQEHHVPLAGRLSHHLTPDASGKSGCSAGWSD